MKNMRVAGKLTISFIFLILLTIIVGSVGIIGMVRISQGGREMYISQAQPLVDLGMARQHFQKHRVNLRDIVIAGDDIAMLNQIDEQIQYHAHGFHTYVGAYLLAVTNPEKLALLDDVILTFNNLQADTSAIVDSARAGTSRTQMSAMIAYQQEPTDFVVESLAYLASVRATQAWDLHNANDFWFRVLFFSIITAIAIVIVVAALLSRYLGRHISRPLEAIGNFANQISDGTISISEVAENSIPVTSEDELGELARNLEKSYIQLHEYERSKAKAENASKAKSDFLSKMSHEIRTPMNAILGMAELMLREDISGVALRQATIIKQSGNYLLSILNDILDFSKVESGKMEILNAPYLFHSTINDVINITKIRMADTALDFAVFIDHNIPGELVGDEIRLRQILLNVLSNSIKYTKDGHFTLEIMSKTSSANSIDLIIKVSDTGSGIKQEHLDELFSEFSQFQVQQNRHVEGTGLGLAITRNLLQLMGGNISVSSEYGSGSEFTINLPQGLVKSSKPYVVNVADFAGRRVLLYGKTPLNLEFVAKALNNMGVAYLIVTDDNLFERKLYEHRWTHVFAEDELAYKAISKVRGIAMDTKVVMMSETIHEINEPDISLLVMPAYFLSIANVFTGYGVNDVYFSKGSRQTTQQFKASDAKVLIVDDMDVNLFVCEGMLEPYEVQITLCTSGRDAIEAVRNNEFDLVLMDHMMPEMDGVETVRHIRELSREKDDRFSTLPIIALTANTIAGAKEMFLNNGFNDFLAKPMEAPKLHIILAKWIPPDKHQEIE